MAQGRPAEALELARDALERLRSVDEPALAARCRFTLARARWSAAQRGPDVREQAAEAADAYRRLGPAHAAQLEEVLQWLAEHPDGGGQGKGPEEPRPGIHL
ncbi:MAG: hypothetical protein AB1Z98_40500 [Nannocystaceae bacterium]